MRMGSLLTLIRYFGPIDEAEFGRSSLNLWFNWSPIDPTGRCGESSQKGSKKGGITAEPDAYLYAPAADAISSAHTISVDTPTLTLSTWHTNHGEQQQ